jgi:hypothetical protein
MILVPLVDLRFLERIRCLRCRDLRSAVLVGYFEGPIRVDPLIFLRLKSAYVVGKAGRDPTDTAMTAP